ncbi:MAG: CHAD domain-containing protein [Deltaproteobacteria bacterium]|nr:CHAD domain-containing protein [Deltaproteobacteria bacterium]
MSLRRPDAKGTAAAGAERFLLRFEEPIGPATAKVLARQAEVLARATPGALEGTDPEHLHDLRVASRRVRFALRVLAPYLVPGRADALREELGTFMAPMAAVRDLDVFRAGLPEQLRRVGASQDGAERLVQGVETRWAAEHRRLRATLETPRWARLLRALARAPVVAALAVPQPVGEVAPALIARGVEKVRRWKPRMLLDLPAPRLHRLRVTVRRLRYTCEYFVDLFGDEVRKLIAACVAVQDVLGAHQDATVALELLHRLSEERIEAGDARPEELIVLGALLQVRREDATIRRDAAVPAWKALLRRAKFVPAA